MADIYVFIGPPGAGKGTVGEMFCEKTKAVHVSTGDILRQEMAAGTDLGNKVKGIIAAGGLVSDDIVAEMVENRLKKDDIVANGCLLDGFPRTVPQAEALKGILQRTNHRMAAVVLIEADNEMLITRLTSRRMCSNKACGAIFNIIFDPILIFGYFGFPQLGVVGAAIATVSGQFFAMFLGLFFLKRNKYLKIRLLRPRMGKKEAKDILTVGIPSIIMQGIGTIMTSAMNAILIVYDVLAATVFGVYFKLQSFVFMPILGLNAGLLPILGYNYGAKNKPRMMKALKLAAIFAVIFMSLCSFVFIMFPDALLGLFNASDSMKKIGEVALRTIAMMFPISAVCITLTALFQAMGDGIYSMIISIIRQLLLLIPSAWILGKLFGLDAIWYAFLVAEVFAFTLSLVFLRKELKKLNF